MPNPLYSQTLAVTRVSTRLKVAAAISLGWLGGLLAFFTHPVLSSQPCEDLNETACFSRLECQAVFNQVDQFSGCVTLSRDQLEKIVTAYDLCERTGGEWQKNRFGMLCDCNGINKTFQVGLGCK